MDTQASLDLETIEATIRSGASFSWSYLLMNILAATIACYGLLSNSPAVVIGAMIVAMLLGPITAVGLALVDSDMQLLRRGLLTLISGTAGVLATALILGTIHRDIPITGEIRARTMPSLLDLMIALAGGTAGAYAMVSPRLGVAFVGVAIATALVPPLASGGILLARGEFRLALGALLLAFTNMVAIQFATSVVLWVTGFRGFTRRTGLSIREFVVRNAVSMIILLALSIILAANLQTVLARQLFESTTRGVLRQQIEASEGSYLTEARFDVDNGTTIVRAVMRGPATPSAAQVAAIEAHLPQPPDGTDLELRVRYVNTTVTNRHGELYDDAEFGTGD